MATSGTYDWNPNTALIINGALRLLSAIQTGETPPDDEYEDALAALNGLTKAWQASGIHVWTELDATLFLQAGVSRYVLGAVDPDHCCITPYWAQTSLTADVASGFSVLHIAFAGNLAQGDQIGIWLDSGFTFWTTVAAPPTGLVVYTTDALPTDATSGAMVIHYPTNQSLVRPLKVPAARRYLFAPVGGNPIEIPMSVTSRLDWGAIPNKNVQGVPTQFFFDPQLVLSVIEVWPVPVNNLQAVKFTATRPLQDFSTQANTADFPQEWISALRYNLAVELAAEYDCPVQRFQIIKALADEKLMEVRAWDRETEPVLFGVGYDPAWRS